FVVTGCAMTFGETPSDSLPDMPKLVITATRKSVPVENAPSVAYVTDAAEVGTISAKTAADALEYILGLSIEGGTGSGGPLKKNATINGLPSNYSLVLVNGARLLSSHFHTGTDINLIPADNIERIEVIKDATSSQYGSDALGGVINIITRDGSSRERLVVNTALGTQGTYRGSMAFSGGDDDRINFSVYTGWNQTEGVPIIYPAHRIKELDYRNLSVMDRINARIGDRIRLQADVNYFTIDQTFRSSPMQSKLFMPQVKASVELSPQMTLDVQTYYTRWESAINNEINEVAAPQVMLSYRGAPLQTITGGAEYNWRNFQRSKVPMSDQHLMGFFAQDELHPIKNLTILAAARVDMTQNSVDSIPDLGPVFSPRISMLYRARDWLGLRLSAGRGFKAPLVMELYEVGYTHGKDLRYGNTGLNPEYSTSVTGGIETALPGGISLTVNGFYNRLTDMIYPVYEYTDSLGYNVYVRRNIKEAMVAGGETGIRYVARFKMMTLDAIGGVSITRNKDLKTGVILPYAPGNGLFLKLSPSIKVHDDLVVNLFGGVKCAMDRQLWNYRSESSTTIQPITTLTDFQKVDAGVSVRFGIAEYYFRASNLLEQEIETYEDALMKTEGTMLLEGGVRIALRK
ncbi:MAG: TonB-dependent receptor, partial [Chitinispirillaceae bacterium]|nr:TonB-dependent receptor [Chitinispirillaceae bacterium]